MSSAVVFRGIEKDSGCIGASGFSKYIAALFLTVVAVSVMVFAVSDCSDDSSAAQMTEGGITYSLNDADNTATAAGMKYGKATVILKVDGKVDTVEIQVVLKPESIDESKETAVIVNEGTFADEIRNSGAQNPEVEIELRQSKQIEVSKNLIDAIRERNGTLSVKTPSGSVAMGAQALKAITYDRTTVAVSSADIPSKAKGASAAIDVSTLVDGGKKTTEFEVPVLVGMAYELKSGQNVKDLNVYYIPESGAPVLVEGAYYVDGTIWFETTHFSVYAAVFGSLPEESTFQVWVVWAVLAIAVAAIQVIAFVTRGRFDEASS